MAAGRLLKSRGCWIATSLAVGLAYNADSVGAYNHVLGADIQRYPGWTGGYNSQHIFHEPLVVFGYMAGITTKLELVTAILILGQRQTALVAKQAAEVDVLSGGRLRLGMGWNFVEYEALGQNFQNRGRRIGEQIQMLRELWTMPIVIFTASITK